MKRNNSDSLSTIESVTAATLIHKLVNTFRSVSILAERLREDSEVKGTSDEGHEALLDQLVTLTEGGQLQLKDYLEQLRNSFNEEDRIAPVNVNLTVQESLKEFKLQSDQQDGVLFRLDLRPDLPDVRVRKRDLLLALNNLLHNSLSAVEQLPDNKPVIRIKSHVIDDRIAVDVIDNGPGIPEKFRSVLFDAGASTKGSSGVGLWLSRLTIRRWGGELELVSTGKSGTTFRISLNRWELPITARGQRRVLIVEDELTYQAALRYSLESRGFEVTTASTVAEALDLIRTNAYDIALLDIILHDYDSPSANGLDIARIVREYNPEALIIMHSAFASLEYMKEAFQVGIDDYIDKASSSVDELIRRIEEGLPRKLEDAVQRRETRRESLRRERQDRFIYETLSIFSHELRGPLIAAHWNLEALTSGALGTMTSEQSDALESIRRAIKREFVLLDTHLDLSRIERGIEVLNYTASDLVRLMREEIAAHEDTAKRKGIKIKAVFPPDTAMVRIDVNRFRAALNPLIDNAIKFSNDGSEVSVSVMIGNGSVEVHISDRGPGIKPEELDSLLGRGVSSDIKLNQRIRASGLGLSLAKRIIEDYHEGQLWFVRREHGESGTTVAFRLPVQP